MVNLPRFPANFDELRSNPPAGFHLSGRLIEPVILIERKGHQIIGCLAGSRMQNGGLVVTAAPSNEHTWIAEGSTIRPLPHDAAVIFKRQLGNADPGDLRYGEAIQLMREEGKLLRVHLADSFIRSGAIEAAELSSELTVPGLNAKLFSYQARGVQWMQETIRNTGGLILADEMGLGKTLQIIALLLLELPGKESPALIVCPTSLIANWEREFSRFAPQIQVMVHRGPGRTGIYRGLQVANVVIATYDTVVNDVSIFASFEWSWVICDEAQAIKNPDSIRRNAIVSIPRRRSIPMTGTPVENSLSDLWSLADMAIPGLLGTRRDFENTYPDNIESAQALRTITDPIILKRRVADVATDLPARIDVDVPIDLDESLVDDYLQVRQLAIAKYPVAGALVATLQLQLFCAHPWLIPASAAESEADDTPILRTGNRPLLTAKMERAKELIIEACSIGRKVICFALFNRVGDLLKEAVGQTDKMYWGAINGSTEQQLRQKIIDEFSSHKGPACLVLNPKAAGAGLNITAATVVIHFTPVWNPALEAQASARAHRRGQTQPVTVYRLFYKHTVEEIMVERSTWKNALANETIPISSRDADDVKRALGVAPRKT